MPTYDYRCRDCDHRFEIQQSFSDDALTECPECGGALKKVFGNVGITFKGSGFYKTDSRSSSSSGGGSSASSTSSGTDSGGSSSSTTTSSDSSSSSSSSSSDGGSSSSSSPATSGTSS